MSATTTAARKSSSAFLARGLTVSRSFQVRNRTGRGYPYSNLSYLSSTRRTSSSSSFSTSSSTSYSSSPPPTETSDTTTTKTATRPTIPGNGKISAVPFAFGPEAARERTYLAGLLASAQVSNLIYATASRFFGSWATSFLREFFGLGNTLHHKTTKAALYPIWRWQIVAEVKPQGSGGGGRNGTRGRNGGNGRNGVPDGNTLKAFVHDGYLPGNAFSPLSLIPYATQPIPNDIPTYDPAEDLTQIGPDVPIIPIEFTVSPFKTLDLIKSQLGRVVIWDGQKIDLEKDLVIKSLSTYPIYFPMYISEFVYTPEEKGAGSRTINIMMDAHDPDADSCRLTVPRPFDPRRATMDDPEPVSYFINAPTFMNNIAIHADTYFGTPQSVADSFSRLPSVYAEWLNPPARSPTLEEVDRDPRLAHFYPPQSPLARIDNEGIDWDDKRIMNWNSEDHEKAEKKFQDDQLKLIMEAENEMSDGLQRKFTPTTLGLGIGASRRITSALKTNSIAQQVRTLSSSRRLATSSATVPSPSPPPVPQSVLDRLPDSLKPMKPYLELMRIDKPIGTVLLYWPCAWAITLASTITQQSLSIPLFYMSLFGIGALIMRGAGCTINDMWDHKIDKAVERTRSRPMARGDVTHFQALSFLGLQLTAGLAVLTQLNWYSILLGAASLSLVVIYPAMKRITYYPQFVLSLAFNWGALLGWSAVAGQVDWAIATPLYAAGITWCMIYDTIYAHQDKTDDILANVKSTALRFGDNSRIILSGFATTMVSLLTYVGYIAEASPLYYLISCVGSAVHLSWQLGTVDFDSRKECWSKFVSNGYMGGIVWLGTLADYFVRTLDITWLMW